MLAPTEPESIELLINNKTPQEYNFRTVEADLPETLKQGITMSKVILKNNTTVVHEPFYQANIVIQDKITNKSLLYLEIVKDKAFHYTGFRLMDIDTAVVLGYEKFQFILCMGRMHILYNLIYKVTNC